MPAPIDTNFPSIQQRLTRASGSYLKFPMGENLMGPFEVRWSPPVQLAVVIGHMVHCLLADTEVEFVRSMSSVFCAEVVLGAWDGQASQGVFMSPALDQICIPLLSSL